MAKIEIELAELDRIREDAQAAKKESEEYKSQLEELKDTRMAVIRTIKKVPKMIKYDDIMHKLKMTISTGYLSHYLSELHVSFLNDALVAIEKLIKSGDYVVYEDNDQIEDKCELLEGLAEVQRERLQKEYDEKISAKLEELDKATKDAEDAKTLAIAARKTAVKMARDEFQSKIDRANKENAKMAKEVNELSDQVKELMKSSKQKEEEVSMIFRQKNQLLAEVTRLKQELAYKEMSPLEKLWNNVKQFRIKFV
jgi:seryl-tRNA synthetase